MGIPITGMLALVTGPAPRGTVHFFCPVSLCSSIWFTSVVFCGFPAFPLCPPSEVELSGLVMVFSSPDSGLRTRKAGTLSLSRASGPSAVVTVEIVFLELFA
jgi:hypothetical protein